MPDNPTGPDNSAANPSPGPADVTKEIETLRAELAESSKRYEGLRSLQDRRYQEFQQSLQDNTPQPYQPPTGQGYDQTGYYPSAQQPQGQYAYQGYQTPQQPQADLHQSFAPLHRENEEIRRDLAQTRFLQRHPEAAKTEKEGQPSVWDEMQRMAQDPALAEAFTVRQQLRDGRVVTKYDDSYDRLYESVKSRHLEARVVELQKAKTELDSLRNNNNARAVVSGVSGSQTEQGFSAADIEKMSSDEMLEKGLVPIDPANPPTLRKA